MSKPVYERLKEGLAEVTAIQTGARPAARIHINGHAYVPENQWQPIETAPKDGTAMLVYGAGEMAMATRGGMYRDLSGNRHQEWHVHPQAWEGSSDRGGLATLDFIPTHWMLPDPPNHDPQ